MIATHDHTVLNLTLFRGELQLLGHVKAQWCNLSSLSCFKQSSGKGISALCWRSMITKAVAEDECFSIDLPTCMFSPSSVTSKTSFFYLKKCYSGHYYLITIKVHAYSLIKEMIKVLPPLHLLPSFPSNTNVAVEMLTPS